MTDWEDLRDRLQRAAKELRQLGDDIEFRGDGWDVARGVRKRHLQSKAEGVDLALEYMRSYGQ